MERKPMDVQRYLAIRRRQISRRFVNETEKRENMYQMVHGGEKQNNQYEFQPYWNPYKFVMKCLISALLIFLVNMTVNSSFPYKEQIVQQLETDFKFATAANWYEEHFSQLFSFVKPGNDKEQHLLIPVGGKVLSPFSDEQKGIIIEASSSTYVEAIQPGVVIFSGDETVVIQHADQTESVYGLLKSVTVKPYEKVEAGTKLGHVANEHFYFALKQDGKFIDPIQVIQLD